MHDGDGDGVWDREELTAVLKMQRHAGRYWKRMAAQSRTRGLVGRCPPRDIDEVLICLGEGVVTFDWFLLTIR